MEEEERGKSDEVDPSLDQPSGLPRVLSVSSTTTLLGEQIMSAEPSRESSSEEDHPSSNGTLSDIPEHPSGEDAVARSSQSDIDSPSKPTNAKRPPLIPQESPSTQPEPPPQVPLILPRPSSFHLREKSIGDYSLMSALTDSSGEGDRAAEQPISTGKKSKNHRNVSWDQNVFDAAGIREKPATILQPVLQEKLSPFSPKDVPLPEHRRQRTKSLNLADLKKINPIETEAETAIIAALEEESRIDELRSRADSASVLMPHVPDEGVDMFETTSGKSNNNSARSLESRKASVSTDGTAKAHRRKKSTMPPEGLATAKGETLEATLSDLADTMRMIHTESTERVDKKEVKRNHRRLPSKDIGHPAALIEDTPVNNTDVLVHNANRLLRRNIHKDESSVGSLEPDATTTPTQEKPKPPWNIFDANPDPKKTDGDKLDGVPEESEVSSEGESSDYESSDVSNRSDTDGASADIENGREGKTGGDPCVSGAGGVSNQRKSKRTMMKNTGRRVRRTSRRMKRDWHLFTDFLRPKRASIAMFCKIVFLVLLPLLSGVSAILFYLTGNPLMTRNGASVSWLLLFLCRQVVTLSMSAATSLFVIDYLSLRSRCIVRLFGPTIALFIVQSNGWPFLLSMWSIYSFILLSGEHALANHWLFWQDLIDMCNANNPSGGIPSSSTNYRILGSALAVGIAVSIKRVWVGLYLGRRTFAHYGDQLAKVIQNIILISEVASLGRDFERNVFPVKEKAPLPQWDYALGHSDEENSTAPNHTRRRTMSAGRLDKVINEGHRDRLTGSLSTSQKIKMIQLLDHWEEPETVRRQDSDASINAILQFRQALAFMDNSFPFSLAFGLADSREACIESAQKVYERLMLHTPDCDELPFDTIAIVATNKHGSFNVKKMKGLIRIFRPDREGNLNMVEFVKSCDNVYKSLRLLRASIANAGQIDHAVEVLINWAFYIVLACLILAVNGFNPLAMFLSFSSILLAFAFMIGSASSKYFEGILFILVRRPYDIGDRIAVADVNSGTDYNGTISWIVQKVDLFTTTVRYSGTNEVATIANGSLAMSRIINGARSPKAAVHVFLKFGTEVPYSRIQVFKKTVENFIKSRPREWVALSRFRATRVEADLGFIEYALDLQHRESWQNNASILMSKADLASFCLEVSKQLDMRYSAPSLPVDLNVNKDAASQNASQSDNKEGVLSSPTLDVRAISALFDRSQD